MDPEKEFIDAAKYGWTEEAKKLLEEGVDIHAQDDTALRYACFYDHIEIVKLLLEKGANINANHGGPLLNAAQRGLPETVRFLLKNGADIHAKNDSALKWAYENGHTDTIQVLLTHYKTQELKSLLEREGFPHNTIKAELESRQPKATVPQSAGMDMD